MPAVQRHHVIPLKESSSNTHIEERAGSWYLALFCGAYPHRRRTNVLFAFQKETRYFHIPKQLGHSPVSEARALTKCCHPVGTSETQCMTSWPSNQHLLGICHTAAPNQVQAQRCRWWSLCSEELLTGSWRRWACKQIRMHPVQEPRGGRDLLSSAWKDYLNAQSVP